MSAIQKRKRRGNASRREVNPEEKLKKAIDSFMKTVSTIDDELTQHCGLCADANSPLGNLRPLMKALEISCHGVPWILGTIVVLVTTHIPEHFEIAVNLLIVLLGDLIIVALVKLLCQRQRPVHNKNDMFATVSIDHYSFPSGHASRAAMLAYFFAERVFTDAATKGLISLWAMFVCMSRVLLGRHHVFDVLFGIFIGICEFKLLNLYWLPQQLCLDILEPFFGHFHL